LSDRVERIRAALREHKLDAIWISCPVDDVYGTHSQNRRWASGFTGSTGHVVITRKQAVLAVDFRYIEQAEREAVPNGFRIWKTDGRRKDWAPKLAKELGIDGRLGISRADMSYGEFVAMHEAMAELKRRTRPKLVPAPPVIEAMRKYKDTAELAALQLAIDIGDKAFETVSATLKPGKLETEVALELETEFRQLGAEGPSFATIVAGGPWGAMPHASPRPEPLPKDAPIVMDLGALANGYCSDLTRTVFLGDETPKFREIYGIVLEAQQNAIGRVESGMTGVQAHRLAHEVIEKAGYGEQFGHGLGHGVGLQVHESPYLGMSSEDTLEDGMVFTIEPGIYLPGWGGVRIEDVVVLENGRARVLSHARKLIPAGV
jgi:Xaa-Pro aminopeptidase